MHRYISTGHYCMQKGKFEHVDAALAVWASWKTKAVK
jgi:hypothetical protein